MLWPVDEAPKTGSNLGINVDQAVVALHAFVRLSGEERMLTLFSLVTFSRMLSSSCVFGGCVFGGFGPYLCELAKASCGDWACCSVSDIAGSPC